MARMRFVKKDNNTNLSTLSIKENIHIAKGKKYKKIAIVFAIIAIFELILIIYRSF